MAEVIPDDSGRVILDYTGCPLAFERIQPSVGEIEDLGDSGGAALIAIRVPKHSAVHRILLSFECWWRLEGITRGAMPYFVLPDFLPRPLVDEQTAQAEIVVEDDTNLLSVHSLRLAAGGTLLQAALIETSHVATRRVDGLTLVGNETGQLSGLRPAATVAELTAARTFLTELFGVPLEAEIVIFLGAGDFAVPNPPGLTIPLAADYAGLVDGDVRLLQTFGMLFVANLWWGAAIRVGGSIGAALCQGVAQWAALQRATDEARHPHADVLRDYLQEMSKSHNSGVGQAIIGSAASLALRLDERQQKHGDVRPLVRSISRELAGATVPSDRVLALFADVAGGWKGPNASTGS